MCACVSVFVSVCVCVCSRCFRSVSSHWIYTLSTSSASQLTMRGLRSTPRSSPNDGGGAQEKPTLADLPPTRLQIHQPPLQPPQPPAPTAHAGGNFLPLGVLFTPPPLHRARTLAHLRLVSAHRAVRTLFRLTRGRGAAGGGRGLVGGGIGAGVSTQPRKSSDGLMRTQDASRVVATDSTPVLDALSPLAAPTQVPYLQLPCLQLPYLQLP